MTSSSKNFMTGLQVLSYHEQDDYYMKDGITEKGQWFGNTAQHLGLSGDVEMKDLYALANGIRPESLSDDQFKQLKSLDVTAAKLEKAYEAIIKKTNKDTPERNAEMDKYLKAVQAHNNSRKEINKNLEEDGAKIVSDTTDKSTELYTHKRGGFDLTFSAPKSVSVMALAGGDERLIEAHAEAVKETMQYVEKYFAQIRPTSVDGTRKKTNPQNLSAALFEHYTSRSVKDQDPDLQLHTHAFIFNVSHEGDKFYSIENKEILKAIKITGQMYQNSLANKIKALGYATETKEVGGNYITEIKGVEQNVLDVFSKRHLQLDEALKVHEENIGRTLSESEAVKFRQMAVLTTRATKRKGEDLGQLRESWDNQLNQIGYSKERLQEDTKNLTSDQHIAKNLDEAIRLSITTLDSRSSVFNQHQIFSETAKTFLGEMTNKEIHEGIAEHLKTFSQKTDIYHLGQEYGNDKSNVYSSKDVMQGEANILNAISDGMGKVRLMDEKTYHDLKKSSESFLKKEAEAKGKTYYSLTAGQAEGMMHIATSEDRIIAIQGDAGTGKTTMLKNLSVVVDNLKQMMGDKIEIEGFAATGIAKTQIQKSGGFNASTIDSYLRKPAKTSSPDVQKLFIVDEASMISTRKMEAFITKALNENAKIVFIGDSKQLKAIEEGDIFSKLQSSDQQAQTYQMKTVIMDESIRQKTDENKKIANAFKSKESFRAGLEDLKKAGNIFSAIEKEEGIVVKDLGMESVRDKFVKNVAADYIEHGLIGKPGVIALVTKNSERKEFNAKIRKELQDAGVVGKDGLRVKTYTSKSMGKLDEKFAGSYNIGDVMISKIMYGDIKKNSKSTILSISNADNSIKIGYEVFDKKNNAFIAKEKWINANNADRFDTFIQVDTEFAAGDKISFTKNGKIGNYEVSNGESGIIKNIDEHGRFLISKGDEEILINPKEYKFLTHGYVVTTHKAQGQTAGYAHVFADSKNGLLNLNAGYVQMTRSEYSTKIYTDSIDDLINKYAIEQKPHDVIDFIPAKTMKSFAAPRENHQKEYQQGEAAIRDRSNLAQTDWNKTYMDDYKFEVRAMAEAKLNQEIIDSRINRMKNEVLGLTDQASGYFEAAKVRGQSYQSKNSHFLNGARYGQKAKDLKIGIRYQQLQKLDLSMIEKGEIDFDKQKDFFVTQMENDFKKGGKAKEELEKDRNIKTKAFLTNQARKKEYFNRLVSDGILSKNEDGDKYSLNVSRRKFIAYQNSTRAVSTKYDIAQNAWDKSLSDSLFDQAKSRTDALMIAGGGWDMKAGIEKLKKEGIYTKEVEEIFKRLDKRYQRLQKQGYVKKTGGKYYAIDSKRFKNHIEYDNSRLIENYEKKSIKEWRADKENSFTSQLDRAIMKQTKISFGQLGRDIKSTYWGTKNIVKEKGFLAEVFASTIAVALGTGKTIGRGVFGAVYRSIKTVVRNTTVTNELLRTIENDLGKKEIFLDTVSQKSFSDKLKKYKPQENKRANFKERLNEKVVVLKVEKKLEKESVLQKKFH